MQCEQEKTETHCTMKSILRFKTPAFILCLIFSLNAALAQTSPVAVTATGQPVYFDPTTGQPIPNLSSIAPEWKDPNWKDPDISLTNVFYDNLPLSEIARNLRDQFKEQFDIILPGTTGGNAINRLNGTIISDMDWNSIPVQLRLKNVTASEIFSAMNLIFENDQTPLRWELKVNGHRQVALLRALVDRNPNIVSPPREDIRRIYFIGELIGDEKTGGMSIDQIIKTITDVWDMADTSGATIKFHKEAQLLVVNGTPSQIDFMEQTLKALRMKIELARRAQLKGRSEEPNTGAPAPKK
jgi:hypothetical protein